MPPWENPLVRRGLRLTRPQTAIRDFALLGIGAVVLSALLGVLLSLFPARFLLEEVVLLVALPSFFAFGMTGYFSFARYIQSQLPMELHLTPMKPASIVEGLYIPATLRAGSFMLVLWLILPLYQGAIVEVGWTGYLLFAISFVCLLEWVSRLMFLLFFLFDRLALFFLVLGFSLAGFAMVFGVSGVLSRLPDDPITTPLVTILLAGFFWLLNVATWKPFIGAISKLYIRRVEIALEGDRTVVDAPEPVRYYQDED